MAKTKGCGTAKAINPKVLEALATAGATPAEIARYYGLTRQGFNAIIEKNEELNDAFYRGKDHVLVRCVRCLIDKVDAGNSFEAIYLLNNRYKWKEEKYRKEKEVDNTQRVMIYLPDNNRGGFLDANISGETEPTNKTES